MFQFLIGWLQTKLCSIFGLTGNGCFNSL